MFSFHLYSAYRGESFSASLGSAELPADMKLKKLNDEIDVYEERIMRGKKKIYMFEGDIKKSKGRINMVGENKTMSKEEKRVIIEEINDGLALTESLLEEWQALVDEFQITTHNCTVNMLKLKEEIAQGNK